VWTLQLSVTVVGPPVSAASAVSGATASTTSAVSAVSGASVSAVSVSGAVVSGATVSGDVASTVSSAAVSRSVETSSGHPARIASGRTDAAIARSRRMLFTPDLSSQSRRFDRAMHSVAGGRRRGEITMTAV